MEEDMIVAMLRVCFGSNELYIFIVGIDFLPETLRKIIE